MSDLREHGHCRFPFYDSTTAAPTAVGSGRINETPIRALGASPRTRHLVGAKCIVLINRFRSPLSDQLHFQAAELIGSHV